MPILSQTGPQAGATSPAALAGFVVQAVPESLGALVAINLMGSEDGIGQVKQFDSIYLGAVGYPGVPDHVSLWGLLIPLRRELDQYANVRPVRLLRGIASPLTGRGPEDIDFIAVRENVEGEYSEIGGRLYRGSEQETAVQESIFTRRGHRPDHGVHFRAGKDAGAQGCDLRHQIKRHHPHHALLGRTLCRCGPAVAGSIGIATSAKEKRDSHRDDEVVG